MGLLTLVFLSFCYVSLGKRVGKANSFDVTSFGAIGDGNTDDTKAFMLAWNAVCRDKSGNPTLIVPSRKTFLLKPIMFNGPCQSPKVNIQLSGNIVAPKSLDGWKNCIGGQAWIQFSWVHGLTINGPGQIDGQGSLWWRGKVKTSSCSRPKALSFNSCDNLQLRGTKHINSPMMHICINGCHGVDVANLQIIAPGDSPNTDGINVGSSTNVHIHDSSIQTGDDCVAINGGSYGINVTRVFCGPGHGISIGSLGEGVIRDNVERVRVVDCNLTGTQNGVRIKTVPGGRGYAREILFQKIHMTNVANPIIIDQHYCIYGSNRDCPEPPGKPAVQVSSVTYENIYGSSVTKQAITLNCSGRTRCTDIVMNQIGISGEGAYAYCQNAQGQFTKTEPKVVCK